MLYKLRIYYKTCNRGLQVVDFLHVDVTVSILLVEKQKTVLFSICTLSKNLTEILCLPNHQYLHSFKAIASSL